MERTRSLMSDVGPGLYPKTKKDGLEDGLDSLTRFDRGSFELSHIHIP